MTERSNPDEVICPACVHQFAAIPENVQEELRANQMPKHLNASYEGDDLFTGEQLRAAVAVEREACAKVIDDLSLAHPGRADLTALQCAAAIRARG